MLNILKQALIYTGVYFLFCIAWTLVLIGLHIFWKPVLAVFVIMLGWFGWQYYVEQENARRLAKLRACATQ